MGPRRDLSPSSVTARRLILAELSRRDLEGEAYPDVRALAAIVDRSPSTTHAALRRLELEGLVVRHAGYGLRRGH